ncbi:MAG: ABC transporter permease [Clostridiaceae bacterium]|nr:ABC transporter permease [Clostridiaceae bacterium]
MESEMNEFKENLIKILKEIAYPLVAIFISVIAGGILVYAVGKDPIVAYTAMIKGSLGDWNKFGETLVTVTPLILTGLSIAFAFKCNLFNIGVEGQFIMGAIAAVWAGWAFTGLPAILHLFLTLIVGAAAGGLWASIIGWLKAKVGSHEVINGIMMNYIAMYTSNYLVRTLLNVPGKAYSVDIADTAKLWRFSQAFEQFNHSRMHIGIIFSLIAALAAYYILNKTVRGYEIRAVGFNPHAAEYGGISVRKNIILSMIVSGLFAGLAGGIMTTGVQYRVNNLFGFTGYGLDGIAVALVGNNHPIGVILSAFLFGVLQKGGPLMQIQGIPKEVVGIIQGIIILFVAANFVKVVTENIKQSKELKKTAVKEEVE